MPELPEVETIRRDLSESLIGRRFNKIKILGGSSVRSVQKSFVKQLRGVEIKSIERRGKLLIFNFNKTNKHLMVHLKMTGQLIHTEGAKVLSGGYSLAKLKNGLAFEQSEGSELRHQAKELPNTWTRVQFGLDDGSQLFFNDIRRFGFLKIVDTKEKEETFGYYGIEPLTSDFTAENFRKIFKGRTTSLKALLLNQQLVAGLGNIYVDEICFFAGVRPLRRVNRLTKKEINKLHEGSEVIIAAALENRGTSFSDYRDAKGGKGTNQMSLKVYGRGGKPCVLCGEIIVKVKLAGRGTSYCRKCQK